jgi:hypothetical protein
VSAESDFRAVLTGYANLTALVPAAKIAQNAVDSAVEVPYIVFTSQHIPEYGLDNTVLALNVKFRVQCWADDPLEADSVADQVVAALLAQGVVCTDRQSIFDPNVGLDATALTADWWDD